MDPPSFDSVVDSSENLPAYSSKALGSSKAPVEHVYTAEDGKGIPWLTLNIASKASSPSHLPLLLEGEPIVGAVSLDLIEDAKIKSVTISVEGHFILTNREDHTLVSVSEQLFPQHQELSATSHSVKSHTELHGHYSWPFSIQLPRTVELKHDKQHRQYKLPATFVEKFGSRVSVVYRIFATVTRGMLSTEHIAGTNAIYIPDIRPEPPSAARQSAYLEGTPLLGPVDDPDGWQSLPAINMRGSILHAREVDVNCTLSLAKPLSYTRGSVIPVWLILESSDAQALDLLSAANAMDIRLRRRLSLPHSLGSSSDEPGFESMLAFQPVMRSLAFKDDVEDVCTAVLWPQPANAVDGISSQRRVLQGEIHLEHSLQPSTNLDSYSISYNVELFPCNVTGFSSAENVETPLQTIEVEIATMYPEGPHPIKYSNAQSTHSAPEKRAEEKHGTGL